MNTDELTRMVADLRRRGKDSATVEAKAAGRKLNRDVWESISAFANTDGGTVILGLDESRGFALTEGFNPEKIKGALRAGLSTSEKADPKVAPIPEFVLEDHPFEDGYLVTLTVAKLMGRIDAPGPCYVKSQGMTTGSYKRVDNGDEHLNEYEIFQIRTRGEAPGFDREPVSGSSVFDLSRDQVERFLASVRRSGSRALRGLEETDVEGALRRLNVMPKAPAGEVTLAGLLTLGDYPQQEFPQLTIDVAVHPGVEKSTDPRVRFVDRQNCDGPIPQAVQDAINAVLRNLRTHREVVDGRGRDVPEIPPATIREAITNAVLHRDYSPYVRGQQVAVDVYSDRVEVTSPGGFWGHRTKDNVDDGVSESRNEALARLLNLVPMPDGESRVAENQGSGVQRMFSEMREQGLPAPDYSASTLTKVVVKLYRFGLLDPQVSGWLDGVAGASTFSTRERIALAIVRRSGEVSVSQLRAQIGVDSDEARVALANLSKSGVLSGAGDGPYVMASSADAVAGLTSSQTDVLKVLDVSVPLAIREIAERTGKSPNALRPVLRELVERGLVHATAPAQSRKRAYLLAE
ncbi:ATP-dependent DNA helicase RecG [Arcanobacterium wilhelmae]|uniref:ATP-dependent DNA helicase RecG n=1 Tax=Arcanobacterium wilhelmae TaxID=1803177 RepID=A0ABT9NBB9_9ACTO|nr:ATP-binding protein [Arcanobacterium wilhelmae]MDP9801019.1 ATP-dependent DNA helicase RecG [Arcanobacterium wilhelmae]WFN90378.1 ATP-binding protein [Arcanobacterium wilhelmae]